MEENQEKKYFTYGSNQIELQATLDALSNNVQSYVNKQAWSAKRKLKFLDAYSDIISRGISGANNTSGLWALDLNSNLDISTLPKKDLEMYHEAAYYILEQMKTIPTKEAEKAEETKDLPLYDHSAHTAGILSYIGTNMFGGRPWNIGGEKDDWNSLDERDTTTGIRGTNNRAAKLAKMLEGYANSLEEGKYNFEGSPYADLNDLKTRISTAVTQLRNGTWDLGDKDALNQIGLDWRDYFNDGSGDVAGTDDNGNPITYAQLASMNQAAVESKAKQDALTAAAKLKENAGVLNIVSGVKANEAANRTAEYTEWLGLTYGVGQQGFDAINTRIQGLLNGAYAGQLDGAGKKELGNLLHYIVNNNPNYQNYNLTPEEESELQIHGNMKGRRLQDFRRLPWNTSDGRHTYVDKSGNVYFLKPRNLKLLLLKFVRSAKYNDYKNNFLVNTSTGSDLRRANLDQRTVGDDFKTEDYLRMAAIALDIVGTGASFAPGYGTVASGVLGLTSLGTNMTADILDESVSKGEVVKNAAINLGLGIVGLVPGLGGAARSGRWLTLIAKWTPRILTLAQAGYIALDDDVKNSLAKATDTNKWNTITNHDLKNISYALSTVAGLSRGARGIYNERKFGAAFKTGAKTENKITTESGKKVTVTDEQLKELNKIGRKSGNDAANKYLNEKIIGDATGTEKVDVDFKTGKLAKITSPTVKAERVTSSTEVPHRTRAYLRALSILNQRIKSGLGIYKFAPRFLPTDYEIYQKAYNINAPLIGLMDKIKQVWNPIKEGKFREEGSTSSGTSVGSTSPTGKNARPKPPVLSKAESKEIKETFLGKAFSTNNDLSDTATSIKGFGDVYRMNNGDGTHTIRFELVGNRDFEIKANPGNLKPETLKLLRSAMKQIDKDLPKALKSKIKIEVIKELKRLGMLRKGGRVNNFNLDKTISEFLKNLK